VTWSELDDMSFDDVDLLLIAIDDATARPGRAGS
jgi:hypothetical protein